MATSAIAGAVDKVLANAFPGVLKEAGMQVYNNLPVFAALSKGGRKVSWQGESMQGRVVTAEYNKAASYQNDDPVDTQSVEPWTAFQYELGGYQVAVTLSGMKIRKVQSDPRKLVDLVREEVKLATVDMMDEMDGHLLQTTNDSKGLLSTYTITDATTTIAGIAGGTTWGGTTTTSGSFNSQGPSDLMTLYNALSIFHSSELESGDATGFGESPDLHITTRVIREYYWRRLQTSMRYTPGGKGDINLDLTFMGKPIIVDEKQASGVWTMLNSKHLKLAVMSGADFTELAPLRESTQPDVWSRAIIWNGQLMTNARRYHGKLISITA